MAEINNDNIKEFLNANRAAFFKLSDGNPPYWELPVDNYRIIADSKGGMISLETMKNDYFFTAFVQGNVTSSGETVKLKIDMHSIARKGEDIIWFRILSSDDIFILPGYPADFYMQHHRKNQKLAHLVRHVWNYAEIAAEDGTFEDFRTGRAIKMLRGSYDTEELSMLEDWLKSYPDEAEIALHIVRHAQLLFSHAYSFQHGEKLSMLHYDPQTLHTLPKLFHDSIFLGHVDRRLYQEDNTNQVYVTKSVYQHFCDDFPNITKSCSFIPSPKACETGRADIYLTVPDIPIDQATHTLEVNPPSSLTFRRRLDGRVIILKVGDCVLLRCESSEPKWHRRVFKEPCPEGGIAMIAKINQKSVSVIWFYRSKRTNLRAAANKLPIDEIYLSDHYQNGIPHFSVIRKVNVSFDPKNDAIYDYFCTRWYSIEDASFDGVTLRKFIKGLKKFQKERSANDLYVLYQRVTSYNNLSLSSDVKEEPAVGNFYAILECELNSGSPMNELPLYSALPTQKVKRRRIDVEVIVDLCNPPTNWHLKSVENQTNPNIRPFSVLEITCISGPTIRLRKFIPVLGQYPDEVKTATFATDIPKFMVNELYYTNESIEIDFVRWKKLEKRAVNVEYCNEPVDSALRLEAGDLYFFRYGYQNGEVLPIDELINEEKLRQYPSWRKKFPIMRPLVAAELYAGSGSMGRGYEQCGVAKVKWSIDVEPCAAATSKANGTADRSILDDAGEILYDIVWGTDSKELSSSLPKPGEIEFLFGGPPCQAFSRANRTDSKTPKNSAKAAQLLVFLSWVDVFRPKYVQLENVTSLSNKTFDDNCLFSFVLSFLLKIGYSIRFFWIYAFDYGICQSRCRLILWASKSHLPLPQFPLPTHYVKSRKEIKPEIELPSGERLVTSAAEYINTSMLPCPTLFEIIGNVKLNDPYHFELPLPRQSTVRKLLNQNTNVRRVSWSSLANTVLTTPKLIHPSENRWISVREAARVQGFPDDYYFVTNTDFVADAYKLIGNAVPPKLTFVLGLELRKRLAEVYNNEVEDNASDAAE